MHFSFGKSSSGFLANCSLCGTKATFSFSAQYVQVFPLKPAPFGQFAAGLGSTNKSAIFFSFSPLRPSLYFRHTALIPTFNLPQTFWRIRQELFFLLFTARLQFSFGKDADGFLCIKGGGILGIDATVSWLKRPLCSR